MRDRKRNLTPITQQLVEAFRANTDQFYLDNKLFDPVHASARRLLKKRRKQRAESPLPCHTNLASAFVDGQSFLTEEGGTLKVTVREVGNLVVTSGRIVVCDPCYGSGKRPLARTIPTGRYPVLLSFADGRIACAMLRIRRTKPVRWEMAVWPGQDPTDIEGDQFFGYGVDAGTGSFLDADQDRYLDQLSEEEGPLFDHDARTPKDPFAGEWAERVFDEKGGNLIAFSSGYGDGRYPSYWGLDANDEPVCLVTDFNILIDHPGVSFFLPGAFRRPPGEVRHRALDLTDLVMEVIPGRFPRRSLIVGFLGPKAESAGASLQTESGECAKTEPSDINVSGSNGITYSYQEHVLPAKGAKRNRDRLGLQVYLPLNACPMQAIGAEKSDE
jgi:Protein of unknown function (DUF4241)